MIKLRSKSTRILVILSLLLSISLQIIWLSQLFASQKQLLKNEFEELAGKTAQTHWYQRVAAFEKPQNLHRIRQLFLSQEWVQLRLAFDNMKAAGVQTSYRIDSNDDSTSVEMTLNLKDSLVDKVDPAPVTTNTGMTDEQLKAGDSLSYIHLKEEVSAGLALLGIRSGIYFNSYSYNMKLLHTSNVPKNLNPAYLSKGYLYGLQDHHRYQLVLAEINNVVFYRMRYYIASSFIMLLLTGSAFYLILRLLDKVRLYTDARADFVRNMTHELKTPIATASVALESIEKYKLIEEPEILKNYIDISRQELKRLDLLVDKALKIDTEGNNGSLNKELYDIQTGIQKVIAQMQPQLIKSNSSIIFNPLSEPVFVSGDPVHLENVFYNLIENAMKYSGTGLAMEINCAISPKRIALSFRDNGPGIDKIYHRHIFDKFFRVPSAGEVSDTKGTGIGLYYVKQMLEKHGGKIKVQSNAGHGSCFIITLPTVS